MTCRTGAWLFAVGYAVAMVGCGSDPEKAGDECDPDDGCPNGMVCAPGGDDHICYNPPGGSCDPNGPDYCLGDSECSQLEDGTGICGIPEGGECDPENSQCVGELTCAELSGGGHACFPDVQLQGMVFDAATTTGVEGAHVIALDAQATAITDVAVTDAAGNYALSVPIPRNEDGSPVADFILTLRASAQD
jgi:hypothetical protein